MSKDKQISEMAKVIEQARIKATVTTNSMNYGFGGWYAKELYNADYRKTSDVAEEIFAEIKELLNVQAKIVCKTRGEYRETDKPMLSFIAELDGRLYSLRVVEEQLAELKKKYTESEGGE